LASGSFLLDLCERVSFRRPTPGEPWMRVIVFWKGLLRQGNGNPMQCSCRILGRWRNLRVIAVSVFFAITVGVFGQTAADKSADQKAQATKPSPKPSDSKSESNAVLVQLNSALESLAAKVSPAVVQILVTSYGTAR